jgi:hypothetical protein
MATRKIKKLTPEIKKILQFNWGLRLKLYAEGGKLRAEGGKLYAEGGKLRAEGNKLRAEGDKLYAEGDKLYAEGDKLWAEGDKLWAEGDKLWAETILEFCGNIKMEWKNWNEEKQNYDCELEDGTLFKQ